MTFDQFAMAHGLIIRDLIHGRIMRCHTEGKPNHKNGAYLFDGEWGWVQDWSQHSEPVLWKTEKPVDLDAMEKRIAASKEAHRKDRERLQGRAAGKAKWILEQCELSQHAYLDKKGFPDMRGNVYRVEGQDPLLVIPMRYNSNVCGCQLIGSTGEKKFLYGQRTNDATFTIGQTGRAFIVEGYASALSLNAILAAAKVQSTIYVTFSVGNASRLAKRFPDAFWLADNDTSGVGQTKAAESGLKWWMPPTTGTDVNDWHQSVGLFKASQILRKQL